MSIPTRLANLSWMAACRREHARFRRALGDPQAAQREILHRLLAANVGCAYGRKHGFAEVRNASDYQQSVPINGYDDLSPWIDRTRLHGEQNVLTTEPVRMFEKTSGSTSASGAACKYIPYTASLRAEFQRAIRAWMFDLYRHYPGLLTGPAHWFITPAGRTRERTPGGLPVGFETDAEYLGVLERWLAERIFAVPGAVARFDRLNDALYATLRFLLQAPSLAFISAWNPSLLAILLRRAIEWTPALLDDLASGGLSSADGTGLPAGLLTRLRAMPARAAALRALGRPLTARDLWPNLRLISCWTDAAAAIALPEMRAAFPGVPVQGKGLLATEGIVTVPLGGCEQEGAALAVCSHFYEFVEAGDPGCVRLAHELEPGGEYTVLLTTGGGLWRYRLNDRVRVTGRVGRTPLLRFLGKEDDTSDLRGEKLGAAFVGAALTGIIPATADFTMLAPVFATTPHYALFVQSRHPLPSDLAGRIDNRLRQNPHYDYCRNVGQLAAMRVFRVRHRAQETYLARAESLGMKTGNVKPTVLHRLGGWEDHFEGGFIDHLPGSVVQEPLPAEQVCR